LRNEFIKDQHKLVLFYSLSMVILLFFASSCRGLDAFISSTTDVIPSTSPPVRTLDFTSIPTAVSPTSTQTENQQIINQPTVTETKKVVVTPPASLWRDPVSDEAWETKHTLEAIEYTQHDFIDLAERLGDPGQPIPHVVRDEPWGFEIGDSHTFWVENNNHENKFQIMARLAYETPHAYFFVDNMLDLSENQLRQLADYFEQDIYPTTRAFFGQEWSPGVDNDPHLTVLMTKDLDSHYQISRDEYSRLVNRYSNEMEMIYIDVDGERLVDLGCVLAHEFGHVIQWAVDKDEEVWLVEGFSELTCPVNGLRASYSGEVSIAFARQPDKQLNTWVMGADNAMAQYGASYLFTIYFLDRFGEEPMRALVAHPEDGLRGIDAVLSSSGYDIGFEALFADWVVANYINDASLVDGRYGYVSLDPPIFKSDAVYKAVDLPVERVTDVSQFGTDYIVLEGEGAYQIDFAGNTMVRLMSTPAYSGTYSWWGGQGTHSDTTLTGEFDLTGVQKATLRFFTWYDILEGYEYGYVEVSTDGERWTTLPGQTTTSDDPNGSNYGHGYTGSSDGWIEEVVDLTPYAGEVVLIRFQYLTDEGPVRVGWLLDNITIPELDFWDNVESGEGNWVAEGFSRSALILPQDWLVQLVKIGDGQTIVERLELNADNSGSWLVQLGAGERAILVISGCTRMTNERGEYWYKIANR
jgi:hypothetical protein